MIFAVPANVDTNSEIRFNPIHTVFFYNIEVIVDVSKRILKIRIGITSFTNSLIQNYVLAGLKFNLRSKKDLYLPYSLSIK